MPAICTVRVQPGQKSVLKRFFCAIYEIVRLLTLAAWSARLCEGTMLQCSDLRGEECDNRMKLPEKSLHWRPRGMQLRWGWSGAFVHSGYGWQPVGGRINPAKRILQKWNRNVTNVILLCGLQGWMVERNARECPAEKPRRSRALVALDRQ